MLRTFFWLVKVLLSGSRTRAKRLAEDLRDYNLSSFYSEDVEREVNPGEIMVTYGHVTEGYEYPMIKFIVISETDIFGQKKKKRKRKVYEGQKIQSFSELKVGDYVVHENHGLGIYQGIEKIEVDKVSKDYMKIAYAAGGNLYIPATQLDLIQKYASADAKKPKLNRLGGQEWTKTKTRVRGAVKEIAKDLVELYTARQEKHGFVYGEDTVWQREFEEMFPFEETDRLSLEAIVHEETYHDYTPGDIDRLYAYKESLPENKQFILENNKETLAQVFTDVRYKKEDNEVMSENLWKVIKKQGF